MTDVEALPAVMTIAEAAALLRISTSTAYSWAREGALPTWRVGRNARTVRIHGAELQRMLGAATVKPDADAA